MTRRAHAGIGAVLVATVVLLAGASAAAAPRATASKWARTVCGALSHWQQQLVLEGKLSPASSADGSASQAALTKLFGDAALDTGALVKMLRAAGTPAVQHGSIIEKTYVSAYTQARDGFRSAARAATALSTNDLVAFTDGVAQLQVTFQKVLSGVADTFARSSAANSSPKLDRALAAEPACRPFVGTLEPPCNAAQLLLAASQADPSIHTISDFKCGKGWAGANVAGNHVVAELYRAQDSLWVVVDRGQFCDDPSIPSAVHHYCEVS